MHTRLLIFLSALLFAFAQDASSQAAGAPAYQSAADIPAEVFFRPANYAQMRLSPDGNRIAMISGPNPRRNLSVIDLKTRQATRLTSFPNVDVFSVYWVDNTRLFFITANMGEVSGEPRPVGRYAVNVDGSDLRDLLRPTARSRYSTATATRFSILARTYDSAGTVIVEMNERQAAYNDVYRYDTRTGDFTLLSADSPGDVVAWVLDRNNVPRIAVKIDPRRSPDKPRQASFWHRASADAKWQRLALDEPFREPGGFVPLGFDYDGKTLYVSSNAGRDRAAIFPFNTETQTLGSALVEHPLIDLDGGLVFSTARKKLLGITYSADMPATAWFDDTLAKLQQRMDKTFPEHTNDILFSSDTENHVLIHSISARDPGTYFLYHIETGRLEKIGASRPWLPPSLMGERRFVRYTARDGRVIPAWLTLPAGSTGKNLPLIVHIHGGPWVRAYHGIAWGNQPIPQFLASRGYAVLEPEPRGSTGFGTKHFEAGFGQWGLAMQDDITDGALHLVAQGIVDKSRMCLFGASYGGYASLQGLVKDPTLWRCGSAYMAATDLGLLQTDSFMDSPRNSDFLDTDFKRMVGDKDTNRAQFDATSPARNAARIEASVMLVMGSDDLRVPIVHGTAMRDAMAKAGKPIEYHVYEGEGHGLVRRDNVVDFFKRNERFFEKHLKAPSP
jgi:dipeptidyl aminopeptidase/acylaminoacyl peptidase